MALWNRLFKRHSKDRCLACGIGIVNHDKTTNFECNVCGLKGLFHDSCLHSDQLPVGGAMILSTGLMCPRCAEDASKPVAGVSEDVIDKIIALVNQFDVADKRGDTRRIEQVKDALSKIGTKLDEQGGMQLMQQAYKRSIFKGSLGPKAALLNYTWDGIGQWSY